MTHKTIIIKKASPHPPAGTAPADQRALTPQPGDMAFVPRYRFLGRAEAREAVKRYLQTSE